MVNLNDYKLEIPEEEYRGKIDFSFSGEEWVYGNYIRRIINEYGEYVPCIVNYTFEDGIVEKELYEVEEYSLSRWTGKCDKHGTRIYTGDIIASFESTPGVAGEKAIYIFVVCYDVSAGKFIGKVSKNNTVVITPNFQQLKDIEIIGNIFDDAETAEKLFYKSSAGCTISKAVYKKFKETGLC